MLLDPARFEDFERGRSKLTAKLEAAAETCGLSLAVAPDTVMKSRDLSYLDTPDFALRERGYILRRRSLRGAGNLVLKFRDVDPKAAAAADVSARSGLDADTKFEKDLLCQDDVEPVFSKSTKVRMDKLPKGALKNFSQVFPALAELGLAPDTPLKAVHGRWIQEEKHGLGELELSSGVSVPAQLTLWYEDGKPVVAEFSFTLYGQDMMTAEKGAKKFMRALERQASSWISTGSTKTEWVYSHRDHEPLVEPDDPGRRSSALDLEQGFLLTR